MSRPEAPQSTDSPDRYVADRLAPFGTTIFTEITALAVEHKAINLSQGFPDEDGPGFVVDAAVRAMADGHNQYARMAGQPPLVSEIAGRWRHDTGIEVDPDAQVTVTSGCTEALAATFLGLVNPGDEVILFEPYYDSYRADCALAGATPRFVTLSPSGDEFVFDEGELRRAFTSRTKAILVNTPHNPTGKVFTRAELELIAGLCIEHDVVAIADEVYERLVYEPDKPHIRLATLPGMADRTITLSSLGKTFSFTGWKIGWAVASPGLSRAVRAAHQFLTFATATPLQYGAAAAIEVGGPGDAYVASLRGHYHAMRDLLCDGLERIGFGVHRPAGTYFVMADHTPFKLGDDAALCRYLIREIGVAAIPPSAFYEHPERGRDMVRFAFCKKRDTIEQAIGRLERLTR
jgi:aspartate/methionine/tyrosine aminotransferase